MKGAKVDIPPIIDSPAAVARHQPGFGDATDYGNLAAENITLSRGTDVSALLEGLENGLWQSPHRGYVVSGVLTSAYTEGSEEADEGGVMFYWLPDNTVRADEDTDFALFSPQHVHGEVIDLIRDKMESA